MDQQASLRALDAVTDDELDLTAVRACLGEPHNLAHSLPPPDRVVHGVGRWSKGLVRQIIRGEASDARGITLR